MITLRNWLKTNEFHLEEPDATDLAECLDDGGFAAAHSVLDFSLWVGPNCVVRNTSAGTRTDSVDRYVCRSWPGHVEIADAGPDEDGMSRDEVSDLCFGGDCTRIALVNRENV